MKADRTDLWNSKIPQMHPQWNDVDLTEIFAMPTAYLAIGYSNSILAEFGAQSHERLWERTRQPGGALGNTVKLVQACRDADISLYWTKYEIFRQEFPQSPMDKSQYDFWASGTKKWSEKDKARDCDTVAEIKALMRPEDEIIHYKSLGNVFLGTMLPSYLNMRGIRTVLLSGFHLDWCIEQAARTCRDMGYMPIVIGDACGCGREIDEAETLHRLDRFFAPVISADHAAALIQAAALRKQHR
ncbi:Nicotinamidase-related amidase [Roseovarius lutimaris]|uniref:Nicotinamidase-related amidase n=1 Tax=Roseovarius lutimaris TaxID=1005928 RepID=A0A1I5GSL5_9RHOB|nr:isochorismatase family protein [Roseovarius lutimaris]SFO38903.1 Nicotinamidase-related amidase [Roseovarius lutimaris]